MTTSHPSTQTLLTGFRIVFHTQLIVLAVSIGMGWIQYHDPHGGMHQDLIGSCVLLLGINLMAFVAGCGVFLQRVRLDWLGRKIAYVGVETEYRWREVDVAAIDAVRFLTYGQGNRGVVDRLWLKADTHPRGGLRLLDSRVSPLFKRRPSPLFSLVVEFVRAQNPEASLPPTLV